MYVKISTVLTSKIPRFLWFEDLYFPSKIHECHERKFKPIIGSMIRKPSISSLSRILDLGDALLPFLTSAQAIFIAIWTGKGPKRDREKDREKDLKGTEIW